MNRKWFRQLLYRRLLVALIIILQFGFLVYAVLSGSRTSQSFTMLLELISLAAVLYIIAAPSKGAYKLTWVILILCAPIFGGLFYLMFSMQSSTRIFRRAIDKAGLTPEELDCVFAGDLFPDFYRLVITVMCCNDNSVWVQSKHLGQ